MSASLMVSNVILWILVIVLALVVRALARQVGILYRITKALAEVGLDIRHATVQTVGAEVVDTFYVRGWSGELIADRPHRREIERAVLHAIG